MEINGVKSHPTHLPHPPSSTPCSPSICLSLQSAAALLTAPVCFMEWRPLAERFFGQLRLCRSNGWVSPKHPCVLQSCRHSIFASSCLWRPTRSIDFVTDPVGPPVSVSVSLSLFLYLSPSLFLSLCVSSSVSLSLSVPVCLCLWLSVCLCLSVCLSVCLSPAPPGFCMWFVLFVVVLGGRWWWCGE